jgi:hypothetical protein
MVWGKEKKPVLTPSLLRGEGEVVAASLANRAAGLGERPSYGKGGYQVKVLPRGGEDLGGNSPKNSRIEPMNQRKLKALRLTNCGNNGSFSWGRRPG